MAAKRLGFGDLYAALNDKAPDKFKNGFSGWQRMADSPIRQLRFAARRCGKKRQVNSMLSRF